MPPLEDALTVRPDGSGRWRAFADPDHESITGMFGGWTAAIILRSVLASADDTATPSALTVNYLGAITPGQDVAITAEHLGGERSVNHWRADVRMADGEHTLASAMVVLANRRDTDHHAQFTMPVSPDPDALGEFHAPGAQGQQTMIRIVSGDYATGDTTGALWVRDAAGRALDHVHLAYLADQYAPRSFFWGPGPRPSATLTMSVYFHATDAEIAAVGDDYILNEATGTRGSARRPASKRGCGAAGAPCSAPPNSSAGTAESHRALGRCDEAAGPPPPCGPRSRPRPSIAARRPQGSATSTSGACRPSCR